MIIWQNIYVITITINLSAVNYILLPYEFLYEDLDIDVPCSHSKRQDKQVETKHAPECQPVHQYASKPALYPTPFISSLHLVRDIYLHTCSIPRPTGGWIYNISMTKLFSAMVSLDGFRDCSTNNGGCEQTCTNGYCECASGYRSTTQGGCIGESYSYSFYRGVVLAPSVGSHDHRHKAWSGNHLKHDGNTCMTLLTSNW